ncbi:MAG TPA: hypothetical protein VKZ63_04140 [Kofleriaceae bacterium]|nr:hypothetical protein [Kofleriaceae bacterium]
MWRRVVDCLGSAVEVGSPLAEVSGALDAVLRSYRDAAGEPALRYRLERRRWPELVRDGQVVGRYDEAIDLVPALELDLYQQVIARAPGLVLHAGAVVGEGGRALVFAGRSGAGKSTIVRALLAGGFRYLSEECVAIAGGTCTGLARPLHLDEDEDAALPGFSCHDYPIRQADRLVHKKLLHPPPSQVWHGPAGGAALVHIDHAPDAGDSLEPLSVGEALSLVWQVAFRQDRAAVEAAAALAEVARYRLRTARPEQAIARARALAEVHGVRPG